MGLDGVELIMAVEEEFKIAISDSDEEKCVTVGKLVDLVYSQLRHSSHEPCASQHGFYIVRRHLLDTFGLRRVEIKPETRLDALIGKASRRERWRDLGVSLAEDTKRWPALVRPKWMTILLSLLVVGSCLCLVVFTRLPFVGAFFAAVIIGIMGACLTIPFKREFPTRFSRVQDLAQFIATLDAGVWSKDEVFQKVRAITVEQLGVKESQVTLEAKFLDDLGVD